MSDTISAPVRIGIVIGSTRPGRVGDSVGHWLHAIAQRRADTEVVLLDLADYALPLLDEPGHPAAGVYEHEHTRRWSRAVAACDGFVFVTPEYNHGTSATLKNAIDYLYHEWSTKPCSFVGYGGSYGARAIASLRLVMGELLVADLREHVGLSTRRDFRGGVFEPSHARELAAESMLEELVTWSRGLRRMRLATSGFKSISELA